MLYDAFICHASEDKDTFVRPLAEELSRANIEVWYDEFSLKIGDSIRRSIDKGLRMSRFGVVVLSKSFLSKEWPQYELDGLLEKQIKGRNEVILPVWHNITYEEILEYSPSFANIKAADSKEGIEKVAKQIADIIHPDGSPLLFARDILIEKGFAPPVVTDKEWLEVVEASTHMLPFGAIIDESSIWDYWSFPLTPRDREPYAWGERLAWAYMQRQWVSDAVSKNLSPCTKPEEIHEFVDSHTGLKETMIEFPSLSFQYAPQLTIKGFEGDFFELIENEYQKSLNEYRESREKKEDFGSGLTINGECPLCDEIWPLRHETFGNYKPSSVTEEYFRSGMFGPPVSPWEHADNLFWLLSNESKWLPKPIRVVLLQGYKEWNVWSWGFLHGNKGGEWKSNGKLEEGMLGIRSSKNKKFSFTKSVEEDLVNRIELARQRLNLADSVKFLKNRFLEEKFIEAFIKQEERIRNKRRGK